MAEVRVQLPIHDHVRIARPHAEEAEQRARPWPDTNRKALGRHVGGSVAANPGPRTPGQSDAAWADLPVRSEPRQECAAGPASGVRGGTRASSRAMLAAQPSIAFQSR